MNLAFASIVILLCALCAPAQEAYRLQVDSRLIETTVTVRDARGVLVTNLPAEGFHLQEDGVAQAVRYFAVRRDLPLSIGVIVDASGSQDKFVRDHEDELKGFLEHVMEPGDRAFAVCFGNHLRLVSDWTAESSQVVDGVHRFNKGEHGFPQIGPDEERELGTALNDSIFYSVEAKLAAERGRRRVLVVFSDGEENSSEHDEVDAMQAAQNADVVVYALRTTEHAEKKMTARDRYGMRLLQHLSEATGGAAFDVRAEKPAAIFASIAAELRSMYEIGYYSTNTARDHSFRKITVTVDGEGLRARARAGYVSR